MCKFSLKIPFFCYGKKPLRDVFTESQLQKQNLCPWPFRYPIVKKDMEVWEILPPLEGLFDKVTMRLENVMQGNVFLGKVVIYCFPELRPYVGSTQTSAPSMV